MGEFPAGASAVLAPGSLDNKTRCTKTRGASEPPAQTPRLFGKLAHYHNITQHMLNKFKEFMMEQVEENIRRLSYSHKKNKNIETFCVIGSYSKRKNFIPNDIDCLIITNCILEDIVIENFLTNSISIEKDKIKKSDDTFRLIIDEIEFGLAYFNNTYFYNYIERIKDGNKKELSIENRPWVIGGRIPEVLLTDILLARVIFDKEGNFNSLQQSLRKKYPKGLKDSLIEDLQNELKNKVTFIDSALSKQNFLIFDIGLGDIVIALIRYIYVQNGIYISSLKHIQSYYLDDLSDQYLRNVLEKIFEIFRLSDRNEKFSLILKIVEELLP